MADLKTNLRETSVIVGICLFAKNRELPETEYFEKAAYCEKLIEILNSEVFKAQNILDLDEFSDGNISIIKNGFSLAKKIVETLQISIVQHIEWLGYDTQKDDPIDIIVNQYGFSLKEESYILENMGLYKLLTLLTGIERKRGLHVFKEFAEEEYELWFSYVWEKLILSLPWRRINNDSLAELNIVGDNVQLSYSNSHKNEISLVPIEISSVDEYEQYTNAITREKVVAKWIEKTMRTDSDYLAKKRCCAICAGNNLVEYLNENLDYKSLGRLLQIYDKSYYYAKTTSRGATLLYVPSIEEYENVIKVKSIEVSVPQSQLNVIITIVNMETHEELVLRNECRFSHGQFNGTPEAKMYYGRTSDLSILYKKC